MAAVHATADRRRREDRQQPAEDVIVLKNATAIAVHKTYLLGVEGVPAVRGVSLNFRRGEFITLFGTSGGGKTSLLNLMGTIDKPTKGEIQLAGSWVRDSTPDAELAELRLSKIGFVFQTFNLLSAMTALENVEMPMILSGRFTPSERRKRATMLLERLGMGSRLSNLPSQLSGGEQQRVTIARALANKPEILLLDEPTGDLDSVNTAIVMDSLYKLNQEDGITLVMVTHDVNLKNFASRVVWMRDGRVNRIEHVHADSRKECVDAMRKIVEENTAPDPTAAQATGPVATSVTFAATEFRDATDYVPVAHQRLGPDANVKRHAHMEESFVEDKYFGKQDRRLREVRVDPAPDVPASAQSYFEHVTEPSRRDSLRKRSSSSSKRSSGSRRSPKKAPTGESTKLVEKGGGGGDEEE